MIKPSQIFKTGFIAGLFLFTFSLAPSFAADTAIAPKERMELFNGRDFIGWKFFMRSNAEPALTWSVTNGVIHCVGKPPGYVRTEKDFRDYKLTVEWRFVTKGNTGVLLHMSEPDKIWPRAIEAQGQSGSQGDFWVIDGTDFKEHAGLKERRVPKRGESNEKPIGEWNTYEIICKGDTIRVSVNGKLMNEATECNVSSGKICLQSEGSEIEIRKVTIEPAT
ncbi:MAG: DUF1080 domain-containing protein [Verrucomicrobia bacterium]|nr:MAG: DUF1080 domain-containing protein [Verrucomicrobiota bacterium]